MATGMENVKAQTPHDPMDWELSLEEDGETTESPAHALDSEENQRILSQLDEWYEQTRIIQSVNRYEQAIDDDFYDGLQWADEDKYELESRGQPALVFNETKPAIDWILGTERRTRVDWNVFPRNDADVQSANNKTKVLKFVSDVNKVPFQRSQAFADAAKVGVGWLEDGAQDPKFGDEPLFSRYESWRNMWYDPLGSQRDMSDSRFIFREKWVDMDIAVANFPDREYELRAKAEHHYLMPTDEDEFFETALYYNADSQGRNVGRRTTIDNVSGTVQNRRARVKLIEAWYRKPCTCEFFHIDRYAVLDEEQEGALAGHHGQEFNPNVPAMQDAVDSGLANVTNSTRMMMHCAVFVKGALLQNLRSPYKHDRFPFTPIWGYRRGRDNTAYGVIRSCRDPQEDLNKRRSKALYILSTNRIIMDKGAVDDLEALREEAADPAGIIEKNIGLALDIHNDTTLAEEHIMLERADGDYIRSVSGVTGENLGQETNATSGKAIRARQEQGSTVTAELFDNLRHAIQLQGEKQLSLIEQYYDYPKVIRITDDRNVPEFTKINYPVADGSGLENDIANSKADFVIGEQDWRESVRVAMFEQMMNMISSLDSQIALQLLDLVFEMSDIQGKDEMVSRIRKINGQSDPENQDDPEEQQRVAAQQQAEQEQADMARQQMMVALKEQLAKVKKLEAEADSKQFDSQSKRVATMEKAVELIKEMKLDPNLAPAADALINGLDQEETPQ